MTRSSQRPGMEGGKTQLGSLPRTIAVAANSFIATGGDGFTVFEEGQNPNAPEAHIESLPQAFTAPDPNPDPRITKQG
jgi:2',3'-cyclic-nucleotide 2'-phosphodiesterase (5'-nucleotidase family)